MKMNMLERNNDLRILVDEVDCIMKMHLDGLELRVADFYLHTARNALHNCYAIIADKQAKMRASEKGSANLQQPTSQGQNAQSGTSAIG
jgi:hypothetical protein